jgi:hypothetical protein
VASFLNKLCHYATEAGEACGPTGAEKLPRKVQEVDAESWNYFYIFDIYYSKNQSLISGSNDALSSVNSTQGVCQAHKAEITM